MHQKPNLAKNDILHYIARSQQQRPWQLATTQIHNSF